MQHFGLEEWADFARNVVEKERKRAMQSHLESGCKECGKVLKLWQGVYEMAQRDSVYEPPASVVQSMKGVYVIHGGNGARPKKSAVARLLLDSFTAPRMSGIRSAAADVRQLLYAVGEYRIDMRIEPLENTEKVALVGQILNSQDPADGVSAAPVILLKKRVVRGFSVTNRFGEFRILCEWERGLQLRIKLPADTELSLAVTEPAVSRTGPAPDPADSIGRKGLRPEAKKRNKRKI